MSSVQHEDVSILLLDWSAVRNLTSASWTCQQTKELPELPHNLNICTNVQKQKIAEMVSTKNGVTPQSPPLQWFMTLPSSFPPTHTHIHIMQMKQAKCLLQGHSKP